MVGERRAAVRGSMYDFKGYPPDHEWRLTRYATGDMVMARDGCPYGDITIGKAMRVHRVVVDFGEGAVAVKEGIGHTQVLEVGNIGILISGFWVERVRPTDGD